MIAVASTTAIGAASSWTAIQSPMCNGTGCGPSARTAARERRSATGRPASMSSHACEKAADGQLVAPLTIRQPVGRRADGVHVDDAGLPGSKHGPHPGQPGELGGIPGHVRVEGCRGCRGVASHEQGARSLETAGVGIRGIRQPSLRNGRRPRDLAARPPLALLDGDIGHRPTDPPSIAVGDRDRGQDDERDDHPGRPWHGLEDAGQPGDGDHGDREDRTRRDVTFSRAGVPDRTSAR